MDTGNSRKRFFEKVQFKNYTTVTIVSISVGAFAKCEKRLLALSCLSITME